MTKPGSPRQPLLGILAGRAGLGETFATQALAIILRDEGMRSAFIRLLEDRIGGGLPPITRMSREVDHGDFGRTDIEGQDAAGRPVLIVEAKFSAALTADQIERYLALQARDSGEPRPGFALLVPKARLDDAAQLLRRAETAVAGVRSATACISWGDVLDVLAAAVTDDQRGSDSLEADIVQLRALVEARTSIVLPPLGGAAAGEEWQARRAELVGLVDLATQRLADALQTSRGPQIARRDLAFAPAYYVRTDGPVPGTHVTIGLHSAFAAEGLSPLWLRFNKTTGRGEAAQQIRERLAERPDYASALRAESGHVWIPVELDEHLADEALVDDVVKRIRDVLVAAAAIPPDLEI